MFDVITEEFLAKQQSSIFSLFFNTVYIEYISGLHYLQDSFQTSK